MPWVKRADGTWGEAPVILAATDRDSEEDEEQDMKPTNSVAARAAQFQAAQIKMIHKASDPTRATLPSPITKKKPPPPPSLSPEERMSPAPPPYAPAFPPRRTTLGDDPEPAAEGNTESARPALPAALRRRPPPPPAAVSVPSTAERVEEDIPAIGIARRTPPIPKLAARPAFTHAQTVSAESRPPLPARQSSPSRPVIPPRQASLSAPPLPSRQLSTASAPPLPFRTPQSTPPLPPRSTLTPAPPLPSRSPSPLADPEAEEEYPEEEEEYPEEEYPDEDTRAHPSSSRNHALRPPPVRTTSSSSSNDRTPSAPSWSSSKTGFAKGKAVEFARNRRNCLNPPPQCFSREPPAPTPPDLKGIQITYAALAQPIVLRSQNSNDLAKALTAGRAFPTKPPALLSHDVQRGDWDKLWDDIDETARIEMRASAGLSVATLPLMPIVGAGFAVSTMAERKLRAGRVGPTCKLVEAWNVNFFRPRHLDVYIAQGGARLSGPTPTQASRRDVDPAFVKYQQAATDTDKALALKEYKKWEGKFRFIVRSWPPLEGQ